MQESACAQLSRKLDALQADIDALGELFDRGFDRINRRFDRVDGRFNRLDERLDARFDSLSSELHDGFDLIHALQQHCIDLLTRALARKQAAR